MAVLELFDHTRLVHTAAPMVRYSKLPFRQLVRRYNCDLVYSPMIIADSFVASPKARDVEFTTSTDDRPLVVQFGARTAESFAAATELVAPYADAVDLNCGCPQSWAMQTGYGAFLLTKPDLIRDMVRQAINRTGLPIAIKIRIEPDLTRTVQLAQNAEHVGVAWLAVHGRTARQRSSTLPDYEAIKLVKESVGIPVLANGSIFSLADAHAVQAATHVDGVMAARGLLENPALYAGYDSTPHECIADFLDIAIRSGGMLHKTFMHHLITMCENVLGVADRRVLNSQLSVAGVLDFFEERFGITPQDSRKVNSISTEPL